MIITRNDFILVKEATEMFKERTDLYGKNAWITSKFLIDKKRKMRKAMHCDEYPKLVKDYDIDGCICLEKLPAYIKTKDDAEEYFENNLYLQTRYSAYDCTGDLFTAWYKVCERSDGWYAYHRIARDI